MWFVSKRIQDPLSCLIVKSQPDTLQELLCGGISHCLAFYHDPTELCLEMQSYCEGLPEPRIYSLSITALEIEDTGLMAYI